MPRSGIFRYGVKFAQATAISVSFLLVAVSAQSENYVLWLEGRSESRQNYELELITLLLDVTKPDYGDYSLSTEYEYVSLSRRDRLFDATESKRINISINPFNQLSADQELHLSVPVLEGLLGLRTIVASRKNSGTLEKIESLANLREFSIVQGFEWTDTKVYKHNGFDIEEALVPNILRMLKRGRFDIYPIGVIETGSEFASGVRESPDLYFVPDMFIYYPHPLYVKVDRLHPRSFKRFEQGLDIIVKSGALRALIHKHFGAAIDQLSASEKKVFVLENPHLTEQMNNSLSNSLVAQLIRDAAVVR